MKKLVGNNSQMTKFYFLAVKTSVIVFFYKLGISYPQTCEQCG